MLHSFTPGRVWLDTNGHRIQAHGGSVLYVSGKYYWYGENKDAADGRNGRQTFGVRCYRSEDLYNWDDMGLIIPPDLEDASSSLNPYYARLDHPHIIYNRWTKNYVCWAKVMNRDGSQTEIVLTGDDILGPYQIVRDHVRPLGMNAGGFDLAVAPDGKAYYYFERVHSELICADLTDDDTDLTGYYSTHFPQPYPPYVREAPAHFVRNHKHYLITSAPSKKRSHPADEISFAVL